MKRILIYNQLTNDVPSINYNDTGMVIEQVGSISEVLRKQLLKSKKGKDADLYDVFVVTLEEATPDVVNFIRYVRKNKPELPVVVVSRTGENIPLLTSVVSRVVNYPLDMNYLSSFLA